MRRDGMGPDASVEESRKLPAGPAHPPRAQAARGPSLLALQRQVGNRATAALVAVQRLAMDEYYDAKAQLQAGGGAPRGPGITDEAAEGVGAMFERAETEKREAEQQRDPRWQQALLSKAPSSTPLTGRRLRRVERRIGTALQNQAQSIDPRWASTLAPTRPDATKEVPGGTVSGARQRIEADRAQAVADARAEPGYELARLDARSRVAVIRKLYLDPPDSGPMEQLASEGRYEAALDAAQALIAECSQLIAFVDAKNAIDKRLSDVSDDLTRKQRNELVTLKQNLGRQLAAKPRANTTISGTLAGIEAILVPIEDKKAANAQRAICRAEGRWPANNNPAAVIQTSTRATVGTAGDERDAVVQALDALKDASKPHTWARKWGEYHGNGEGNLPGVVGGGGYKEYYVSPAHAANYPGVTAPGARRLVKSDTTGMVYYSANHYGNNGAALPAFVKITDP